MIDNQLNNTDDDTDGDDEMDFSCPICGQDPCSTDDDSWLRKWEDAEDFLDIL